LRAKGEAIQKNLNAWLDCCVATLLAMTRFSYQSKLRRITSAGFFVIGPQKTVIGFDGIVF
jgi:hypothetical protein